MRHFIYTYREGRPPSNGSGIRKTVTVYRIVKGEPVHITTRTDSFVSEFQLVMDALKAAKALPSRAFEPNQFGGYLYGAACSLRAAGIASVHCV